MFLDEKQRHPEDVERELCVVKNDTGRRIVSAVLISDHTITHDTKYSQIFRVK
jgi:hypothetical protein